MASVEKGKVYPIAYTSVNDVEPEDGQDRVEVVVFDEIDNDDWEWDGLQYLEAGEWEYARESEVEGFEGGDVTADPGDKEDNSPMPTAKDYTDDHAGEPRPMSPQEAIQEFQAYVNKVDEINTRLIAARWKVVQRTAEKKAASDACKEAEELASAIASELSDACAARPDPKRYPLFDKNGASDLPMGEVDTAAASESKTATNEPLEEQQSPDEPQVVADEAPANDDANDDAWRSIQIEQLGLSQGLNDKLRAFSNSSFPSGIKTMGEYCDFAANGFQLTDINGIGKAAVTKIEDAWEAWWGQQQKGGAS